MFAFFTPNARDYMLESADYSTLTTVAFFALDALVDGELEKTRNGVPTTQWAAWTSDWMDQVIDMLKPGMSSDKVAAKLPKAQEAGFASEMDAFGLNFCHGLGLGLHERPLISRLTSLREPIELKAGMVFAVETYCPASDGVSAARIEEEVILTPTGAKIITLFPAEELPIANRY